MNKIAIIILGPQGCGKGTQGRILAKKYNLYYWEMGGILRAEASLSSPFGKKIADLINNGLYVPDPELISIIENNLDRLPKSGDGVIFDGVPRRIGQARYLLDYLKTNGYTNLITLYIEIPKDESIKRLLSRKNDENRMDDTKESIERRLDQNEKLTIPILDQLKQETNFILIDGNKGIDQVSQDIDQAISEYIHNGK